MPATAFTDRGLAIAGADPIDLYCGAMHYWRVARGDWRRCLTAMRSLGLRCVDTYVPWGVHEVAPGRFDWSGDRDLGAFLNEVADAGLRAVLRPGPHINAELTLFGFPERVLANADARAVTSRGTPMWMPAPPRMFPVPSYAAKAFRVEVAAWFEAFAEIAADHLAPDGPVVALQVDNEFQHFFRVGAYDADYHPDALDWWADWTGGVEPPRAWDAADAGRCARWVAFKDEYAARSLRWLAEALRAAGLDGVARFHNFPPTSPTLVNLPGGERAIDGAVGLDFYHRARDYADYTWRGRYLTGSAATLPFAPELGLGGPPWLLPMRRDEQHSVLLGLLATGVRGFNLYMTVDRERWYDAPITDAGDVTPRGRWLARLLEVLDLVDWPALRRRAPIAVLVSRTEERYAVASSLIDPLTPVLTELAGLGSALALDDDAVAVREHLRAVVDALDRSQLPYDVVDEQASADRLERYTAVVMPTEHRIDAGTWATLREVAKRGTRVVIGPGKPTRDAFDAPLSNPAVPRGVGHFARASLDDPDGLAADLTALVGGARPTIACADPAVALSVFEDDRGPRVVFAANRTDRRTDAAIDVPAGAALRDALSGDPLQVVALGPHQVRMLLV